MKVTAYEQNVRTHGFEKATKFAVATILEEQAATRVSLRQLDEYLKSQQTVMENFAQVLGMATGMLDQVGKDTYGSSLRLKQLAMGVKVESEGVQEADASGISASGNVRKDN